MNNNMVQLIERFKITLNKVSTRKNYGVDLRLFFEYMERYEVKDIKDISKIKPMHVREYMAFMKQSGYANASINRRKTAISKFFGFLKENRITDWNVTENIETLSVNNRHNIYLRKDNLIKFLSHVRDRKPKANERMTEFVQKRNLALFLLVLKTGLRSKEIYTLKIQDISDSGMIHVKDRKNDEDNEVIINERELQIVKEYLDIRNKLKNIDGDYVFLSVRGKKLNNKTLNQILEKYIKEIGLENEGITFHKLRHSFAHFYLKNGGNLKGLQIALGHKNAATTNIYAHMETEDVFENITKIDLV